MTRVGAATNIAMRAHNEDNFLAHRPVFLVADGMGGHKRGDVAAEIAVNSFRYFLEQDFVSGDELEEAISAAAHEIANLDDTGGVAAPGSTVSGFVLSLMGELPCARVFNIGDSRTYHLSGTGFTQVTRDHSEVQDLVDAGELTEQEARTAANRNVITRALGASTGVDVGADVSLLPLSEGDRFVLCTDGLSSEVPDAVISTVARHTADPQEAAEILIQRALGSGGRDNVTVVVVDIVEVSPPWTDSKIDGVNLSDGFRPISDDTIPRRNNSVMEVRHD